MLDEATMPQRRSRSRVLKNLLTLYASQIITLLLGLLPIAFLPVYLGATGMGQLTIGFAFAGISSTLIMLGTQQFMVRAIARDRTSLSEIFWSALAVRMMIAIVLLPCLALLAFLSGYGAQTRTVIMLTYCGMAIQSALVTTIVATLQAIERMAWYSAAVIADKLLVILLGWFVLHQGGGIVGYLLVVILGDLVEFSLNLAYFLRVVRLQLVISWLAISRMFRGGLPFFLWGFLQIMYNQASSLILSKLGGETAVGWYGTAAQFIVPLIAVPSVAITVLLPRFSELQVLERPAFERMVRRSMSYMTIITMPMAFGMAAIAPQVIDLFGYPATFQHSIPVLQLLAFTLPITSLLMIMSTAVTATNKERSWAKISLFSLGCTVVLNGTLIPLSRLHFGNPAIGAAASSLSAELLTLMFVLWIFGGELVDGSVFVIIGKVCLASLVMALAVVVAHVLPLPLVIALGGLVYVGLSLLFKVVRPAELAALRGQL